MPPLRTLRLDATPTRSRRLNEVLGLILLVAAGLLLLALATYTPSDPSFNTVGSYGHAARPARNWAGLAGAYFSDAALQSLGISIFLLPLALIRLGICWMRSRPAGAPLARNLGLLLWLLFAPAGIALVPHSLLWAHALPLEGVLGRIVADALVSVLNLPGASIVVALMVALSLYLATTFTFATAHQWFFTRFSLIQAIRERLEARRQRRASRDALNAGLDSLDPAEDTFASKRELAARQLRRENQRDYPEPTLGIPEVAAPPTLIGGLFSWWNRRKLRRNNLSITPEPEPTAAEPRSVWQAMPRTNVDAPPVTALGTAAAAAAPFADALFAAAAPLPHDPEPAAFPDTFHEGGRDVFATKPAAPEQEDDFFANARPLPLPKLVPKRATLPPEAVSPPPLPEAPQSISFGRRADADIKAVALPPKSIRGYKLPRRRCCFIQKNKPSSASRPSATRPPLSCKSAPSSASTARSPRSTPAPSSPPSSSAPTPE